MDENKKDFDDIINDIEEEVNEKMDEKKSKMDEFVAQANEKLSEIAKGTAQVAKNITSKVGEKTQKVVDTTRRTIEAEKLEYVIVKKYKEMGRKIYAAFDKGEDYAHLVDEECGEITELFDQIIAIRTGDLMANASECEEEGENE